MSAIESTVKTTSESFKENFKAYQELIATLNDNLHKSSYPESTKAKALLESRNKLTTRNRVQQLIDPGTNILELGALAGAEMYDEVPPGAGLLTAIGQISGTMCMIIANNPAVKGGTYFPITVKKHLRAQEIASENRLPCVYLVDSGGAYLPLQAEVFPDRDHFGRIFYNQARMSQAGIPQIAAVLGSCTAGGAYVPAMSEQAIMVKENATIFLGGPPLVKAATGEIVSSEELGGAKVHCTISGVADYLAEDEQDALSICRRLVKNLNYSLPQNCSYLNPMSDPANPLYDPSEIYGIVGTNLKKPFPSLEVIARLVDGSEFDEFKARYAPTVRCGFAAIHGIQVGIIANDGILFSESSLKATHFIQLCNQRNIPLLFLQNIVGFMVGKKFEHEGIAKNGAKLVTAVASATVPKLTVIIGSSHGAGNYGMCGRAYQPRMLFTWPNSRIGVMGKDQAANVLAEINFADTKKKASEQEIKQYKDNILDNYERESSPYYATARLWDDGIIDPVKTRETLSLALRVTMIEHDRVNNLGLFRM
jgi:3-methylcrotonyl-CoA carboxylase beta subunit